MPSHYTVLQYHPNSRSGERINLGVFAFDDEQVVHRVLHNWRRVQSFAGADLKPVRDAVEEILAGELTPGLIRHAAETWRDALRFTEPRGSTAAVERLLAQVGDLMLVDVAPKQREHGKPTVLRQGRRALEEAVRDGNRRDLVVHTRYPVGGLRVAHDVDLALQNGRTLLVAQGLSFAKSSPQAIKKDVDATAWVLEDLGRGENPPALAVLVAPPIKSADGTYEEGVRLFGDLNAEVVTRSDFTTWAKGVVRAIEDVGTEVAEVRRQ